MITKERCGNCSKDLLHPFFARCRVNSALKFCPPCGKAEAIVQLTLNRPTNSYGYAAMYEALFLEIMGEEGYEAWREEYEEFMQGQILNALVTSQESLEGIETEVLLPRETPFFWSPR